MGYFDDEYYEPAHFPELEGELETLINHVVGAVKDDVVNQIVEKSEQYQQLKMVVKNATEDRWSAIKALKASNEEIERLKGELDKKLNEHPHFKFKIGDKAYVPCSTGDTYSLTCTKCNGEGKLVFKVHDSDIETATATCPVCGGYSRNGRDRQAYYYKYTAQQADVVAIKYEVDRDGAKTWYTVGGYWLLEEDVMVTRDECLAICQQKTLDSYNKAAKITGHAEATSVDQIPYNKTNRR